MSRDAPNPPNPEVWQAQNLQLISFPVEPQNSTQQNWWHELTGTERESRTEKRREVTEQGTVEGSLLSLSIDLLRVQWTVAPVAVNPAEDIPESPPILGPFLQHKDWFRQNMHRWLRMSPPITRLAFAGVLLQPVENREAGYQLLDRYLRWIDIDVQSRDFLYRVNRRVVSSTIPDLYINRLTTWSVANFSVVVRAEIVALPDQHRETRSETLACALQLDINTVPEPAGRVLPANTLPQIFDELVELGVDIATRGDIRNA